MTGVPQREVVTGEPPDAIVNVVAVEVPGVRMVTVRGVVADSAPDVPVMVAVAVPGCAELSAIRVRMLPVADEAGFQLDVMPDGRPAIEKVTTPLNPLAPIIPTDDFSVPPGKITMPGVGVSVNDGAPTVRAIFADAVIVP